MGIITALFIYGLFVEDDNYEPPSKKSKDIEEESDEFGPIKINGEWQKK